MHYTIGTSTNTQKTTILVTIPNILMYVHTSGDLPSINPILPSAWVMQGRRRLLLLAAVAIFRVPALHAQTNCQRSSFSTTRLHVRCSAAHMDDWREQSRLGNRHLLQVKKCWWKPSADLGIVRSFALMSVLLWHSCCRKYEHSALIVPEGWVNWLWLNIYSRTSKQVLFHYISYNNSHQGRKLS